jgi:hypothetical protein
VRSGDLDALGAAIFDKMAGQKDDPSSVAQEMADAALALIERCKAEQARRETAEAERDEARDRWTRAHGEHSRYRLLYGADGVLDRVRAVLDVPRGANVIAHAIEIVRRLDGYSAMCAEQETRADAALARAETAERALVEAQAELDRGFVGYQHAVNDERARADAAEASLSAALRRAEEETKRADECRDLLVACDGTLGLVAHRRVDDETKREAEALSWRCRDAYQKIDLARALSVGVSRTGGER